MAQLTINIPDEHIPRIQAVFNSVAELETNLKQYIRRTVETHEGQAAEDTKRQQLSQDQW